MTIAKLQHYVPQFLLRSFGNGKKNQIWVYDKSCGRSFISNTKNVASESRFYDFEDGGECRSLEPWLADLEGRAKAVIDEILKADGLAALGSEQRQIVASFLAVQLTRTRTSRETWSEFPGMLRTLFEKRGEQVAPGSPAAEFLRDMSENDSKKETARIVACAPETYAAHFLDKAWVLAATSKSHPFLSSDNPLTRQNLFGPNRGNLGLRTPGVEIYLPLSPTRALAMFCPRLTDVVHRCARSTGNESIRAMSEALLGETPVQFSTANVENFNSLQVLRSERYVFSMVNDFTLARDMINDNPKIRNGPRPTVT